MDTWNTYKNKVTKKNLNTINISSNICYGNYLIAKILWLTSQGKVKQRDFNEFFELASTILQATAAQTKFEEKHLFEVHNFIDSITKSISEAGSTAEDLALMLGNLTEIEDAKYTFTELIAFMRILAKQI